MDTDATKKNYVTCPLCEATCGLEIVTQGREVVSIKGDEEDVFSKGYLCPKAYSLKELLADPDRIREPMVRRGDTWQKVSWEEAFAEVERGLSPIIEKYGRNALSTYLGNPNAHNLSGQFYAPVLLRALGSRNVYSASTVDQMPKQVSVGLMFGAGLSVPIPDIERTDYLLVLGANPMVSNGSLMTAPDMRRRLRDLRKRGGKLVVIDPMRTRTAEEADAHYFIRPGTDACLLFAMVHVLFEENLVALGRLAQHVNGLEQVREAAKAFSPESVAGVCGIEADTIRQISRELANALRAIVYGRIGTCTQEFGTLASWLVDVLNVLTGNLDREGGAMFSKAAAGARNTSGKGGEGSGVRFGRWQSRVSKLPEFFGELPAAVLAEEIETPGKDQIRALITIAENPALSNPNGGRLQSALQSLDFMVSVDIYLNETTRYADVILPVTSPLEHAHYDISFYQLSARNIANYSKPIFETQQPEEWEILLRLAAIATGQNLSVEQLDDQTITQLIEREVKTQGSTVEGRAQQELLAMLQPRRGPERILDFMLRVGPYGDFFGSKPDGLTLATLEENPHGVDLGELQPRIPEMLRTRSGKIELAPSPMLQDVARLQNSLQQGKGDENEFLLIGRRDLRSNNSCDAQPECAGQGQKSLHLDCQSG